MRIHLDKIDDEPFRWERAEPVPEAILEHPELLGISDLRWSGAVERAHPGWRLRAELDYDQTLACNRCLQPRKEHVNDDIEVYLVVDPVRPFGGEVELESADLGVIELDDEVFDTDPLLLDQLTLNIPMSTLCSDDCAGLCPHCGADRNAEPDCCEGGEIDPRWRVLEDLRGN